MGFKWSTLEDAPLDGTALSVSRAKINIRQNLLNKPLEMIKKTTSDRRILYTTLVSAPLLLKLGLRMVPLDMPHSQAVLRNALMRLVVRLAAIRRMLTWICLRKTKLSHEVCGVRRLGILCIYVGVIYKD